jgi:predicted aldo/keto reductase-like oxidoreductase
MDSAGLVRREFLKVLAAAGVIPAIAPALAAAEPASQPASQPATATAPATKQAEGAVPKRQLGKTGAMIPCFAMGWATSAEILERSLRYGFTHWDTATSYGTEPMIGKILEANKGLREKLFLSTKPPDIDGRLKETDAEALKKHIDGIQKHLDKSLKNFGTDYIDLYLGIHAMPRPSLLTDELHKFAEDNKKAGKIKFFGFSNHANTADNLAAAAKLDWIDAILVSFNYRLMDAKSPNNKKLNDAIDACHAAKIGLIAIKPLGAPAVPDTAAEKKLAEDFKQRGFDVAQIKLKLLLEDKRFTSASVGMKKISDVDGAAGAALDKAKVAEGFRIELQQYAAKTLHTYCAGCANICSAAMAGAGAGLPMISDIMRFMMYSESYGERALARSLFQQLPAEAREKLRTADYTAAEAACPQHIAVGDVVRHACEKFS